MPELKEGWYLTKRLNLLVKLDVLARDASTLLPYLGIFCIDVKVLLIGAHFIKNGTDMFNN